MCAEIEHCCEIMTNIINTKCEEHTGIFAAWECPDMVISYNGKYIIPIRDGGPSYYPINYCPFCGKSLI